MKRRKSIAINRYISRVPGGYIVRVGLKLSQTSRMVSDSKHRDSLAAARKLRDKLHKKLTTRWRKKKAQINSRTGVMGVFLLDHIQIQRYNKRVYRYRVKQIVGSYTDSKGRVIRRYWSIRTRSRARAIRLATAWRKARLANET